MIDVIMEFAGAYYMVRVEGSNVSFGAKTGANVMMSTIDNMKLDYSGVIKEFPDLVEAVDWREEAIKRFKNKIKGLKNEEDIVKYVIADLTRWGYKPKYKQKNGFRMEVLNAN